MVRQHSLQTVQNSAFASSQDGLLNIYVMGSNGGTPTQLTRGAGNNTEPSWSPDGSSILFTSDRGVHHKFIE